MYILYNLYEYVVLGNMHVCIYSYRNNGYIIYSSSSDKYIMDIPGYDPNIANYKFPLYHRVFRQNFDFVIYRLGKSQNHIKNTYKQMKSISRSSNGIQRI